MFRRKLQSAPLSLSLLFVIPVMGSACGLEVTEDARTATSSSATFALRDAAITTRQAVAFGVLAQGLARAASLQDAAAVELGGLPLPGFLPPLDTGPAPDVRGGADPEGCLRPLDPEDPHSGAHYDPPGQGGCAAVAKLEVDFCNGDHLTIARQDGGPWRLSVPSGGWAGTHATYDFTAQAGGGATASQVSGELVYQGSNTSGLSAALDARYAYEPLDAGLTLSFSGAITDEVGHRAVTLDAGLTLEGPLAASGQGEGSFRWQGSAAVDALTEAMAPDASQRVLWQALDVTLALGGALPPEPQTASGAVLYGGERVGAVQRNGQGQVVVRWADGVVSDFDLTPLCPTSP